ncbi:hypothetical protein ACFXGA_13025 [Actinosynnema sp. NPDC059335]|uniref:hypothetical protein n=1 Tax=Actinosynnema sp. NPDC059335 TaxID=3346804 RepID=UPI00366B9FD3
MGKTDRTRPWWVRMADRPMTTCVPVHDHRHGVCTLPDEITPDSASTSHRTSGCHWGGSERHPIRRETRAGRREWFHFRRGSRRRDRRRARRELRECRGGER